MQWLQKRNIWYFFTGIGVIFYILNNSLPLLSDDYAYAFIWDGANGGNLDMLSGDGTRIRVEGWNDLLVSQWSHYFTWGGRTVAHLFVQFFVWQGKPLFDICNTLVFLLLILLVYWLGVGEIRWGGLSKKYVFWIFFCLWACNPVFGDTNLWLTSACNYAWMAVLQLLWLLPYSCSYFGQAVWMGRSRLFAAGGMLGLGILAGWSNENSGIAMILAGAILCWKLYGNGRLCRWMLYGIVGAILGYTCMIAAPGNFVRGAFLANIARLQEMESLDAHLQLLCILLLFLLPMVLPALPLLRGTIRRNYEGTIGRQKLFYIRVFVGLSLLNLVLMVPMPTFPARAGFGSLIFLCIASVSAMKITDDLDLQVWRPRFKRIVCVLAALYCMITMGAALYENVFVYGQVSEAYRYAARCPGERAMVKIYKEPDYLSRMVIGHTGISYVSADRNYWLNRMVAQYYGLKSIQLDNE